jgi:hypothetical protein
MRRRIFAVGEPEFVKTRVQQDIVAAEWIGVAPIACGLSDYYLHVLLY